MSAVCPWWCNGYGCGLYTYFEKGCPKKRTRQSRKVLWVALNSLFFKEIWKNGTRGHRPLAICLLVLKESNNRRFDSYSSVKNSVLIISHITFRDCRLHIFSDNLSRNSCTSIDAVSLVLLYILSVSSVFFVLVLFTTIILRLLSCIWSKDDTRLLLGYPF